MPSLQQTTFKDFPSPDIARSLTGPDILQKHSINSLLLEHNEIISRGLPSPIEDNMSLTDLLGGSHTSSSPTSVSSSLGTNSSGVSGKGSDEGHHHHHHHYQQHQHSQQHLQQSQHNHQHHQQQHHATLGSFASLTASLGGNGGSVMGATRCDDSASSILSSAGLSSGGGNSTASGSVSSNPFNFSSLRIPSPSLNSPDLLTGGGLIGGGIVSSGHSTASTSSSSSSSGISCGGGTTGGGDSGQSPTTHSFYSNLQQQQQHNHHSSAGGGHNSGSGGDGSPSSRGSIGTFDEFRFDTDLMLGSTGIGTPNGLTTETLKLRRRNISFDCTSPATGASSPGEGTAPSLTLLCPTTGGRNYRTSGSFAQLQQNAIAHQHTQQQSTTVQYDLLASDGTVTTGNERGITSSTGSGSAAMGGFDPNGAAAAATAAAVNNSTLSLFGTGNGSLSRSHSPPDHTDTSNLLTSLESTSILDMLNYLTLGQSTNSMTGHHNQAAQQQQQQQQQHHQNQFAPYSSTLSSLYQQQQQHQQTTGSDRAFGSASSATNNNSNNGGITAGLSGLSLGSAGFTSDYERLQNLQALNTLRLLQQSQHLSQLQQLQFNQSLLSVSGGTGSGVNGNIFGGCNTGNSNGLSGSSVGSNSSSTGSNSSGNSSNCLQGGKPWSSSQQHHQQQHHSQHQLQRQGSSSPSLNVGSGSGNGYADINLDRIARFHRSSAAAHYDATCTWSGVLPPRSNRLVTYSSKIFLGGMPWDISEQSLVQIFKPFGSIKVEWPGKEQQATQPKGYVYIIFESDKQVKALLQACTYSTPHNSGGGGGSGMHGNHGGSGAEAAGASNYGGCSRATGMNGASSIGSLNRFGSSCDDTPAQLQLMPMSNLNKPIAPRGAKINFKISSKRIKSKDVEVIPWNIADSNYVKSTSQKLDPTKTVFVGALHGQLTAEGLAKIMNDLFDGVVYVGIDTDKYKYPLGSARVTFNNSRSYMKAVVAAFIEIRTSKFTKKLQVDPYLEDSLCSMCTVQHGPYFCREIMCFRYFCRSCWQLQHSREVYLQKHMPLTRNSKFTAIIGVGPQQHQHASNNSNHHQQQQSSFDHSSYYNNHHHNHHHHHHGGNGGHQSNAGLSSHNQYHHNGGGQHHGSNNGGGGGGHHHHQQQQQQSSRLEMLQQQQHHRTPLSKSPSPSMCIGNSTDGNSSTTSNGSASSSNSCSPISTGNSASTGGASSASSSCSNSSLSSNTNGNTVGSASNACGVGEQLSSSCIGSLNMQQISFVAGGGGVSGGSNGSGGLVI
uniref:RRM domain-containing protein n=1 Tax=Anopheles dirus TaxID=7168 RepID=A0A2C9GV87_9DIPT